jgi:RHS repeat-associated protein
MIKYEHYPTEIEPVDIVAEYKYDIYGRRIRKNVNGNITNFHWEGDNMSFELNENHQPIRRYIYENGKDDVQGYVEYSEVDDPQYFSFERKGWHSYIKDQVGTITKIYKHETKQMVETRTYDTFGNIINQTGSSSGNLGFQSKYFDQESGLNYYYHRYYNPSIGRFINEDPIGFNGGLNLYLSVENNPINSVDFFGLKIICKPKSNDWYLCPGFSSNDLGTLIDVIYKTKWKLLKQVYMDPIARAGYIGYFKYIAIFKFSKYLKYIKLCFDFKCCDSETGKSWIETRKRNKQKIYTVQERLPDIVPENWQKQFPSLIKWGKYHWEEHDW